MTNNDLNLGRDTFGDPSNIGNVMTQDESLELLNEWVKNDKLKLHMKQVAEVMYQWAVQKEELPEEEAHKWWLAGILHDADWDQWPDEHCAKIITHLESLNIDPTIIRAIACHGPQHFGVEPETSIEKMLYMFDELSGFVHAVSLVRGGYDGMKVKSVKKKLKDKGFAAGVDRNDIEDGITRIDYELPEIIEFVIESQKEVE